MRECSQGRLTLLADGEVREALQVRRVEGPWAEARFQLPDGGTLTIETDAVQVTTTGGVVVTRSTMQDWRDDPDTFSSTITEIAVALSQGASSIQE